LRLTGITASMTAFRRLGRVVGRDGGPLIVRFSPKDYALERSS
jgi:hypothetical protein